MPLCWMYSVWLECMQKDVPKRNCINVTSYSAPQYHRIRADSSSGEKEKIPFPKPTNIYTRARRIANVTTRQRAPKKKHPRFSLRKNVSRRLLLLPKSWDAFASSSEPEPKCTPQPLHILSCSPLHKVRSLPVRRANPEASRPLGFTSLHWRIVGHYALLHLDALYLLGIVLAPGCKWVREMVTRG